jgi:hypothetical protein
MDDQLIMRQVEFLVSGRFFVPSEVVSVEQSFHTAEFQYTDVLPPDFATRAFDDFPERPIQKPPKKVRQTKAQKAAAAKAAATKAAAIKVTDKVTDNVSDQSDEEEVTPTADSATVDSETAEGAAIKVTVPPKKRGRGSIIDEEDDEFDPVVTSAAAAGAEDELVVNATDDDDEVFVPTAEQLADFERLKSALEAKKSNVAVYEKQLGAAHNMKKLSARPKRVAECEAKLQNCREELAILEIEVSKGVGHI